MMPAFDLVVKEDYPRFLASPEYVAIDMPRYLPICYGYNFKVQLLSISIDEYLKALPYYLLVERIAEARLTDTIDRLADMIYAGNGWQLGDKPELDRAINDATLTLLNVGDELFHQFQTYHLYAPGGYHTYDYYAHPKQDLIILKKIPWQDLCHRLSKIAREYTGRLAS